jgi:hypothetical protein
MFAGVPRDNQGETAYCPHLDCRAPGQCGSLRLHCEGLSPSTPCRSPGALWLRFAKSHRKTIKFYAFIPIV